MTRLITTVAAATTTARWLPPRSAVGRYSHIACTLQRICRVKKNLPRVRRLYFSVCLSLFVTVRGAQFDGSIHTADTRAVYITIIWYNNILQRVHACKRTSRENIFPGSVWKYFHSTWHFHTFYYVQIAHGIALLLLPSAYLQQVCALAMGNVDIGVVSTHGV